MNEDKSSRYHRLKHRAAALSVVSSGALLMALSATGASIAIRRAVGGSDHGASSWAVVALYVLAIGALHGIVSLPFAVYRGFLLERRYGLSAESGGAWAADHAKALGISAFVGLLAAESVYLALRLWPAWWWAVSAMTFVVAMAAFTQLAPLVLLPIFYRFKPLERESLRARLVSLSGRTGVPVLDVYEWGLGDKTRRANAALVGSGRTRRILVSNTLLAQYTDDEIEVILAHELGHHVHRDITKALGLEVLIVVAGFYAASRVLDALWVPLGLASPADVAGLPVLLLAGGASSLAATPLLNVVSRINERRADRFALALTRRPAAFVSALRRLAAQNLAEERPSTTSFWLFHTHPTIEQRIGAAKSFE
jgi:STE24 endopeptidase